MPGGYESALWVALATAGGVARNLQAYLKGKSDRIDYERLIAQGFVGGFSGFVFADVLVSSFGLPIGAAFGAAGIGGYMGTNALDLLIDHFKSLISKKPSDGGPDG